LAQGGVPNSELYYLGSPKNAAKDNSGVSTTSRFSRPTGEIPEALEDGRRSLPAAEFPRVAALPALFIKDPDG